MAELETLYDCTGFCAVPTSKLFIFTDADKYPLEVECASHFKFYTYAYLGAAYNWITGTAMICLFAVVLQLINFCSRMKERPGVKS